ncbi:MAG TPA: hypothetical protein VNA25_02705 [Phycisphaerae bacterium]|nr:hypothetical protein [Phycisphaerae bacterium]HUT56767.1 hypothetical protein [Phycisphaerae bacterium]
MASYSRQADELAASLLLPDDISVRRWFAVYAIFLLACGVPLAILLIRQPWLWSQWVEQFTATFRATSPAVKLLVMAVYLSACTTFFPLPTGWLIAAVATRQAAVGGGLWSTVLLVAGIGAAASTVANLNDYHLFTWMLRHHRISRVRHTRVHDAAARWFARSPFLLQVLFNIIPVPIDVVRMLASSCRYGRHGFAAASFIGRFIRYGVIAFVTYWWNLGWIAVVALLGLAIVLGLVRLLPWMARRILSNGANARVRTVSDSSGPSEEP